MCLELLELEQLATDSMPDDSRTAAQSHLLSCADCRSRLDEVRNNLLIAERVGAVLRSGRETAAAGEFSIGPYRIGRQIGRGGMGVVYEAQQQSPDRSVALKVLHGHDRDEGRNERQFRREIRALARLTHPGIATIYDAGRTSDGHSYIAMELVRGVPLIAHAEGRSLRERLQLFLRVADAVAYAHQRGVIHRDLKPSNIFVAGDGAPKVLDFGLARTVALGADEPARSITSEPGRVLGTIPYMSPEQICGDDQNLDTHSDQYSLGVILFQLLTGRLPYWVDAANLAQAARTICEVPPIPPSSLQPELKR